MRSRVDVQGRRACLAAAAGLAFGLPAWAQQRTLTVSVAASLADAMKLIAARFEQSRPGTTVRLNTGASGALLQQIVQGAPVDIFVSADEETIERGIRLKMLQAASRRVIAGNRLVLIAPQPGGAALTKLADLNAPAVKRIAIGKLATTPVGRYAQEALEAAGLWQALQPKLVFADNVRQVLDYVARAEAEAGLLYATDAALMPDKVRVVQVLGGHAPIVYPAAIVSESRQADAARDFVAFLVQPQAQALLARFGFAPPP
jgi:molybdate transport system substrate-binding protein